MLHLDYRDIRPIYAQITDGICNQISAGVLQKGDKLPSVRELAVELSINPNTIQRAYNELEGEGYIYSVPGKGSFAAGNTGADESRRQELLEKLRELAAELKYLGVTGEELAALVSDTPGSPRQSREKEETDD